MPLAFPADFLYVSGLTLQASYMPLALLCSISLPGQRLAASALPDHSAILHPVNQVAFFDGLQSVGNDNQRLSAVQAVDLGGEWREPGEA